MNTNNQKDDSMAREEKGSALLWESKADSMAKEEKRSASLLES